LHLLVHERVLLDDRVVQLANADRELQVPVLWRNPAAASSATTSAPAASSATTSAPAASSTSASDAHADGDEGGVRRRHRDELARGNQLRFNVRGDVLQRHHRDAHGNAHRQGSLRRLVGRLLRQVELRPVDDGRSRGDGDLCQAWRTAASGRLHGPEGARYVARQGAEDAHAGPLRGRGDQQEVLDSREERESGGSGPEARTEAAQRREGEPGYRQGAEKHVGVRSR